MIRSFTIPAALTGALLLSSCVVPWPNREVAVEGARGEVVEAVTGQAVANALVKVSYGHHGYRKERRSSSRGRFKVAPEMGPWAWGYFISPISGQMFGLKPDLAVRVPTPVTGLEVSVEGFRPWRWQRNDSRSEMPPERIALERRR